MKRLLKCISLAAVAVILIAALTACGNQPQEPAATPAPTPAATPAPAAEAPEEEEEEPAEEGNEGIIFLITDYGGIDDGSFNQGSWEGVVAFAEARGMTHHFIRPPEVSDAEYLNAIEQAVNQGASVIVTPGFLFSSAIYTAQDMFPDVDFILLDTAPARDGNTRIGPNVVSVFYAEEQAGFLAGYAAVMDGFRNLGFMGGIPVPPVVRFGHGFVLGAEHAAESLGLNPGDVSVNYTYVMTFDTSPAVATQAASWFVGGTEVIFAAAGGAGFSVFSAADAEGGVTIGVDSDQHWASSTVLTSALKELSVSVYDMLDAHFNGTFPGGESILYNAAIYGVGLPMETSRFHNFTQAQYDAIFAQLASGAISIPIDLELSAGELDVTLVSVIDMS